jgi:hypothetical protein
METFAEYERQITNFDILDWKQIGLDTYFIDLPS